MKQYLKLMRCNHYIKNFLILLPIFFSKKIMEVNSIINVILGFCVFCLVTSIIYIFNDIKDIEKDKLHPVKKNRPLPSGKVTIKNAYILMFTLIIITIISSILIFKII